MSDAPKEIYYDSRDGYISGSVPPEHPAFAHCVAYIRADLSPSPEVVKELVEALRAIAGAVPLFDYVTMGPSGVDLGSPGSPYDRGKAAAYDELQAVARAALAKLEGGK